MSQPLTLRAVRKAPRLSLILGVIVTALLLVLPFCALLPASHPLAISTYADAGGQNPLLCDCRGGAGSGGATPGCCRSATGCFALGGYAMGMYLMRRRRQRFASVYVVSVVE